MNMLRGAKIIVYAAVGLLIASVSALAQETLLAPELRANPYIRETQQFLNDWNARKLVFPSKDKLEGRFFDEAKTKMAKNSGGYEGPGWYSQVTAIWKELPSYLKPELPLSPAAQRILVLQVAGNIEELNRNKPSMDVFRESLLQAAFPLLGFAQSLAEKASRKAIDFDNILASLEGLWTVVYPLCRGSRPS